MTKEKSFIDTMHFQDASSTRKALGDLIVACTIPTPRLRPQQMPKIIERLSEIAKIEDIQLSAPEWGKDLGFQNHSE